MTTTFGRRRLRAHPGSPRRRRGASPWPSSARSRRPPGARHDHAVQAGGLVEVGDRRRGELTVRHHHEVAVAGLDPRAAPVDIDDTALEVAGLIQSPGWNGWSASSVNPDARPLSVSCNANDTTSEVTPSAVSAAERLTDQTPATSNQTGHQQHDRAAAWPAQPRDRAPALCPAVGTRRISR